jgi:RHS repeat-associated protein
MTFTHDDRGLVTSRTDPFGNTTHFTYDAAGRLVSKTDRNGQTTAYSYTPMGNIDTVSYPDSSTAAFSYDINDRVSAMTDALGITSYVRDAAGRLVSQTDASGFTVGYAYDPAGNLTQITYPGNKSVTYAYDALNRLISVTDWQGRTAAYSYDPAGRPLSLTNFNNTVTTYGHDNADRLTTLAIRKGDSSTIASWNFTLDGNGNRIQSEQETPLPVVYQPGTVASTHDRNRLLTNGTSSFTWDFEGRLFSKISGGTTNYSFDAAHRLTGISGGSTGMYGYDGAGNRLWAARNGVITRYVYDLRGNLLAEADQNNVITRYYIHGLGLLAAVTPENAAYCYHFDATGNTVAVTDVSQNMVNRYAYTPEGITNQSEAFAQPFKYVGQYGVMAEPNGLYYMRARYYDPETGRFISEDPIGFDGGDVNLYVYVAGNPVMFIDPWGLAYRQKRPLDTWGLRNTTAGSFHHDRFLYNDGSDSGYYDDSTVRADNAPETMINKYQNVGEELDDNILNQAEQNVKNQWDRNVNNTAEEYSLFSHNCQDYADTVMGEYDRIRSKSRKNN